jgi:hypothetical protein
MSSDEILREFQLFIFVYAVLFEENLGSSVMELCRAN